MTALVVARREFKDHIRQPWLLVAAVLIYLIIDAVLALVFITLQGLVSTQPQVMDMLGVGSLDDLLITCVGYLNTMMVTEPMTLGAMLGAYSMINDRQNATLPFLLLSPISRWQLLVGKVLGCLVAPLLLHLTLGLVSSVVCSLFPVTAPAAASLPFSAGWCVGFFVSTPIWAGVLTTFAVLASSIARDIRTSLQINSVVNLVIGLATGSAIAALMADVLGQTLLAVSGVVLFVGLTSVGQLVISRDVSR